MPVARSMRTSVKTNSAPSAVTTRPRSAGYGKKTEAGPDKKRAGSDKKRAGPDKKRAGSDKKRVGPDKTRVGSDTKRAGPGVGGSVGWH